MDMTVGRYETQTDRQTNGLASYPGCVANKYTGRQSDMKKGNSNFIMTCLFQEIVSLHLKVPYSALQETPKP